MNHERTALALRSIRVGDIINVFSNTVSITAQIHAKAERALMRGTQVTWEDGRMEWIEVHQRVDTKKTGSAQYTWDKTGEKVLADVYRVTKHKDETFTKKKIGTRYATF
jgi:hypothetical protein